MAAKRSILKRPGEAREVEKGKTDLKMKLSDDDEKRVTETERVGRKHGMVRQSTKGNLGKEAEERRKLNRNTSETLTTDSGGDDSTSSSNPKKRGALAKGSPRRPPAATHDDDDAVVATSQASTPTSGSNARKAPQSRRCIIL